MKTVLCYGNSLTWGYGAASPGRHAPADRWPDVLQAEPGEGVHVVAEGLNGRTTAFDDPLSGADRNGARILPTVPATHAPLDLVVIMAGANDMKPWIHGNPVVASASPLDGVHLDAGNTRRIGAALVPVVRAMLEPGTEISRG